MGAWSNIVTVNVGVEEARRAGAGGFAALLLLLLVVGGLVAVGKR